ncbi:MAG: TetR/AcrR family transcriptional regulator [Microscillaceae bacterium]
MPKPTFSKLPPEKQAAFIEAALREFAQKNYERASINAIVQHLGIAKGSVYQYFENKKDLYLYLVEYARRQKQAFVQQHSKSAHSDFFTRFQEMYQAGMAFNAAHPVVGRFLHNVSQEKHASELGDLHALMLRQSTNYFQKLVEQEQKNGKIRPDLDSLVVAFLMVQISTSLGDFLTLQEVLPNHSDYVAQMVQIMRTGLENT